MIDKVKASLLAVEINITDKGFPKDVPGLKSWEQAFDLGKRSYQFGFATSVVLSPDGKYPLGTSGSGHQDEWETSINYHADKYLKFLTDSLARYHRIESLEADKSKPPAEKAKELQSIRAEVLQQISEANKHESNR